MDSKRERAHGFLGRRMVVVCALAAACGACGYGNEQSDHATAAAAEETPTPQASATSLARQAALDDQGGNGTGGVGSLQSLSGHRRAGYASASASPTATATAATAVAESAPAGRTASAFAKSTTGAMADVPRLDPNARYATTYRPGGAALAAFDAAVARGQIPASDKDLVGDFGVRYAPALARPKSGALTIAVDTERTAVSPAGGPLNLRVAFASSEGTPRRAPLSVHLVLDTSGSMSGQAIDDARAAAEAVVRRLDASDEFSMVTFSDSAHLLVADGPIGPHRAQALERIHAVKADGGTNISSGLDLAYAQAHAAGIPADAVRIVMLLSDGHANQGDTDPQHLAERAARAFQEGVETSSFGLGPDFDSALMSRIADRGAGGYYYLADSSQIAPALAREIDARLRPVATAVELRVRLRPDVSATHVFGSRELSAAEAAAVRTQEMAVDQGEAKHGIARDRQTDAAGGMRFFIPAFARADRHATLITLQLPPGIGERNIASVEVRYKDRLLGRNVTRELPVKVRFAASDAESAATEEPGVERMAQAFEAGETILRAAERVDAGDRAGARSLLEERAEVLKRASDALHEPMLADDGARLARLASAVGGDQALSDPLPLAIMLRGSGYGYF